MAIQTLQLYKPDDRFSCVFAGKTKSGKTAALASFPKPLHIMEFDNRIQGIYGCPWVDKEGITFEYFPPKTDAFPVSLADRVIKYLNTLLAYYKVDPTNIKGKIPRTLALDSITALTHGLLFDSIEETHEGGKDLKIAGMPVPGKRDYGYESNATKNILAILRALPIENLIVTGHLVDVYEANEKQEQVITGQKLSLREKIQAETGIFFNEQWEFTRTNKGTLPKFQVQFYSSYAMSSQKLPGGVHDITGKNFYEFYKSCVGKEKI